MSSKVVMLIDRDLDMQQIFTLIMESRGFEVHVVADPRQAVEQAKAVRPGVIITELFRRTPQGWWLIERLRADPATRHIPVIALSTKVYPKDKIAAIRAGADLFLAKPINLERLLRAVERRLNVSSEV